MLLLLCVMSYGLLLCGDAVGGYRYWAFLSCRRVHSDVLFLECCLAEYFFSPLSYVFCSLAKDEGVHLVSHHNFESITVFPTT